MTGTGCNILVAIDGSKQALEAVRYVSRIFSPALTNIDMLCIGTEFPNVYAVMREQEIYYPGLEGVKKWVANNQLHIGEFKEKASHILVKAGFKKSKIVFRAKSTKINVLKDIIQESYQGYKAVVVGRTGNSRLKDAIVGSMAYRLIGKIRHMPIIVVGGNPVSKRILIVLDDSIELMRAINCFGHLVKKGGFEVLLCHVFDIDNLTHINVGMIDGSSKSEEVLIYNRNQFHPIMEEAIKRLVDAGLERDYISSEYIFHRGNVKRKLMDIAVKGDYGTIVVGRTSFSGCLKSQLQGHLSNKLISSTPNSAIWISG